MGNKAFEKHTKDMKEIAEAKRRVTEAGRCKALPKGIRAKLGDLVNEIDRYKPEPPPLVAPEGSTMAAEEFRELVQEASGYIWRPILGDEVARMLGAPKDLVKRAAGMGYSVTADQVAVYGFSRPTRGRDEIYMLQVFALPGMVDVTYDSGRACCSSVVANGDVSRFFGQDL